MCSLYDRLVDTYSTISEDQLDQLLGITTVEETVDLTLIREIPVEQMDETEDTGMEQLCTLYTSWVRET